jgi:uncharacterized protein (DUF302 family)
MEKGRYVLTIEYTGSFQGTQQLKLDFDEVKGRLSQISQLLGREATIQDLKDVIKAIVNEVREKGAEIPLPLDPSELLGADLEAEK